MSDEEVLNRKGNFDVENELGDLIQEIEENTAIKTAIKNRILNQPQLITLSSANAQEFGQNPTQYNQQSYTQFTCNFVRPALDVESIQLVSANIPNANQNIPDTACVFWYYRMSAYSGTTPSIDNLYMVRLLPSYYKPEWIGPYGQNISFQNYTGLATQLALSCTADIAYDNIQFINQHDGPLEPFPYTPFIPNDISLIYNSVLNKFQFTGNASQLAYIVWDNTVIYDKNAIVEYNNKAYKSLQATNTGNTPSTSPTYWSLYSGEIVALWDTNTTYSTGMIVAFSNILYQAISSSLGHEPDLGGAYWAEYDKTENYYYLSTGPEDPLVKQLQGTIFYRQWNPTHVYQTNDRVQYDGIWYFALQQNIGNIPSAGSIYWSDSEWSDAYQNVVGVIVPTPPSYFLGNTLTLSAGGSASSTPITGYSNMGSDSIDVTFLIPSLTLGDGSFTIGLTDGAGYNVFFFISYLGISYTAGANVAPSAIAYADNYTFHIQIGANLAYFYLNGTLLNTGGYTVNVGNYKFYADASGSTGIITVTNLAYTAVQQTIYNTGDIVFYGGQYYSSRVDNNSGHTPVPAWSATTHYVIDNLVFFGDAVYIAIASSTNIDPTNTSYWLFATLGYWNPTTDIHTLYSSPTGLNYISGQYDMVDSSYGGAINYIAYPFPKNIPAQPFNPNPQRLLNSILGFVWNGVFNPAQFTQYFANATNLGELGTIGTTETSLFNRTRPVLSYVVGTGYTAGLGTSQNPTVSQIYTADTFCNLLYSSIVSVYCDLLTTGTLDSQRTNNILAICPLTSSLGLASFNNFINNPILRVMDHIQKITIQMFDEYNESFWLPTSAVTTFTFKLTYKTPV